MSLIGWQVKDNRFVINSDDEVKHPWGDFCNAPSDRPFEMVIDGHSFPFNLRNPGSFIVFHRDEEGIIDHFYEASWNSIPMDPYSQLGDCPFCGKPARNR